MANREDVNTPAFNKAFVIKHFEEFVNHKNASVAYQNLAPDFLDHDESGGPATGPEPAKVMMEKMYSFLPDLRVSIEDIIAEGDKVMVRNIWSGTSHDGKKTQFKGFVLWKLKDGKIVERWATVTPPYPFETSLPVW
jgi:predicted ester cyclase